MRRNAKVDQIGALTVRVNDLIRLWERFFMGDLRVPPQRETGTLRRDLIAASEARGKRRVESFRTEQLLQRFNTYRNMWERQLRDREEGRVRTPIKPGAPAKAPPESPAAKSESPKQSRPQEKNSPPKKDDLFERYVAAHQRAGGSVKVSREAFLKQIDSYRNKLEQKHGRSVEFEVVVDGSKVKVTARPNRT